MAFFDELSKKLSGVSRVAVRKAKEVTDIGSLKLQIADENRKLSKIYENLGREYFCYKRKGNRLYWCFLSCNAVRTEYALHPVLKTDFLLRIKVFCPLQSV